MKTVVKVCSYIFTALAAAFFTFFLMTILQNPNYSKLEQLESLITACFIDTADPKAMEDAAAEAMVDSLGDRWSFYLTAEDYQSYMEEMNNAYVGVGITISPREDDIGVDIISVTAGGPAEEAGLLPGDILIGVDGEPYNASDLNDVRTRVKGPAGTTVELTIQRGSEELHFTVERREIQVIVAQGEMITDTIGLITITNFDSRCSSETFAAMDELLNAGATALIFDVRNNPGGYKDELVRILDSLLPEGPLFQSLDYTGNSHVDYSGEEYLDIPMAVLVNENSYSAAEFFAAALDEYDAATTVGQNTTGKGYFQQAYPLIDGSAVNLSVGKYYTPNGVSLAEVGGITPDVLVEVDDETYAAIYNGTLEPLDDPQILAAIAALEADSTQ